MSVVEADVKAKGLGVAAIVGVATFGLLVAVIPMVKEGYSPVGDAISDAARGDFGYLQTVAFLALGLGSLSLSWGLLRGLTGKAGKVGSVLIGLWGVGIVLAGIFPADLTPEPETTTGSIHLAVSLLSFGFVLIGIFVLTAAFRTSATWKGFWIQSLVLGVAALVAFFVSGAAQEASWWGVAQRVFVGLILIWLLITAIRLTGAAHHKPPNRP